MGSWSSAGRRLGGIVGVVVVIGLSGCSLFGWGKTVSVSVADSGRTVARSVVTASEPDFTRYEYNTSLVGSADVAGVTSAYEATGTYLGSYSPDVFKVTGLSLAFARSDSDVGFGMLEPGFLDSGKTPVFDLLSPVYVSEWVRWEPGTYDIIRIRIPMDTGQHDIVDGGSLGNDIQVTIPGYTDAEIYAWQSEVSAADEHLAGTPDDIALIPYLGSNRFQLPRLYSTGRLSVGEYTDEYGGQNGVAFPAESLFFRTGITESTMYSDMASSVSDSSLFDGNTFLDNTGFSASSGAWASAGTWADIPFEGIVIGEGTRDLFVTFRLDTTGIFELWEMSDEYLSTSGELTARYRIRLAPDFYERITVEVEQH